jgi:hypothetical protein
MRMFHACWPNAKRAARATVTKTTTTDNIERIGRRHILIPPASMCITSRKAA